MGWSRDRCIVENFQEIKLTKGVYTRETSGFCVIVTEAPSAHRSGIAIFYCKAELRLHGPNVISFHLVMGR